MTIFTRTGDDGCSSFANGKKLKKTSKLLHFFGAMDELNSHLGFAKVSLTDSEGLALKVNQVQEELILISRKLANLISGDEKEFVNINNLLATRVTKLEEDILEIEKKLPKLTDFVIPGKNEVSARFHLARVTCRRTERVLYETIEDETTRQAISQGIPEHLNKYLNRLSDWIYMVAIAD